MEEVFAQHRQVRPDTVNIQENDASIRQKAAIVIQMLKTNFGMEELSCRCMSLNSVASDRCKSQAKQGNLFCAKHQTSGAIASALLKVIFEIEPELIRPLVTQTHIPGGLFETKIARDAANRSGDDVIRLAKKVEKNNCKKVDGSQCSTPTKNSDGYCHNHRSQKPKQAGVVVDQPSSPLRQTITTPTQQQQQQQQQPFVPDHSDDGEDSDYSEPKKHQPKRRVTVRKRL